MIYKILCVAFLTSGIINLAALAVNIYSEDFLPAIAYGVASIVNLMLFGITDKEYKTNHG